MINIMSGQTAVTSTADNAPQKKEKTSQTAKNIAYKNTSAESTILINKQEDIAIFQAQTAAKAEGNNPEEVDYQKEALKKLVEDLRKEYIERNHYIDEDTQISVLQIVNTETDHIIGQYPSDLYLNLLTKVREAQKQIFNETI